MKNNNLLEKFANNKILLFLIPNFICFYQLLYYYNQNFYNVGSVLFYEVIIGCLIYFFINVVIYFLFSKILKDKQKVFCVMCFISLFCYIKMSLTYFLLFVLFVVFLIIDFKHLIKCSLNTLVGIVSFIAIILFSFSFLTSVYNVSYLLIKQKSYDYDMEFNIDDNDNPNIYWIHCDGMMNFSDMNKYFKTDILDFVTYFRKNGYYYNDDASLIAGHSTQRSLTALFNPYYYDKFYKDYLLDLEDVYLQKKDNTDFIVNYDELEEKRINNELFAALKEAGYEVVAIADYSPYTAFYTDKFYDFYYYSDDGIGFSTPNKELRYINMESNSDFRLKSYIRFNHARLLFYNSIFYPLIHNVNYLDYDPVLYDDLDLSNYSYINNTNYWVSKATLKSIEDSYDEKKSQFTFIDYKLAHYPLFFDRNGDFLPEGYSYKLDYYSQNYIYAFNLLTEMLEFIKERDDDAVIVIQADHGLHVFKDWDLMRMLNVDVESLQEVRNSVINAVYVPLKYRNGDEDTLGNPLNISRYLINNYVGKNYDYIE